MNSVIHPEHRASSSLSRHEGESSFALCDRLCRTRANSQRQLPTDHDYAVPTREYQTDQSSFYSALAAARLVLGKRKYKNKPMIRGIDTVTPYQGLARFQNRSPSIHAMAIVRQLSSFVMDRRLRLPSLR